MKYNTQRKNAYRNINIICYNELIRENKLCLDPTLDCLFWPNYKSEFEKPLFKYVFHRGFYEITVTVNDIGFNETSLSIFAIKSEKIKLVAQAGYLERTKGKWFQYEGEPPNRWLKLFGSREAIRDFSMDFEEAEGYLDRGPIIF